MESQMGHKSTHIMTLNSHLFYLKPSSPKHKIREDYLRSRHSPPPHITRTMRFSSRYCANGIHSRVVRVSVVVDEVL